MGRPRKNVQTSTPAAQPGASAAQLGTTPADLLERFKEYPAIDLIGRQLAAPGDPGTLPILLRDEDRDACTNSDHQWNLKPGASKCHMCGKPARKWHVRTINTGIEGRWASIKARGYIPVEIAELRDREDVGDLVEGTADSYARRGDTGREVLVKRPLELHLAIKRTEWEKRNEGMRSKKKLRESLAEAAGAEMGDEAGQTIFEGGIRVESLSQSKTTLGAEFTAEDDD